MIDVGPTGAAMSVDRCTCFVDGHNCPCCVIQVCTSPDSTTNTPVHECDFLLKSLTRTCHREVTSMSTSTLIIVDNHIHDRKAQALGQERSIIIDHRPILWQLNCLEKYTGRDCDGSQHKHILAVYLLGFNWTKDGSHEMKQIWNRIEEQTQDESSQSKSIFVIKAEMGAS